MVQTIEAGGAAALFMANGHREFKSVFRPTRGYEILTAPKKPLQGVVCDMSGVLIRNEAFAAYKHDMDDANSEIIGNYIRTHTPFHVPHTSMTKFVQELGVSLGKKFDLGRPASLTETVIEGFKIPFEAWNQQRIKEYAPWQFIPRDIHAAGVMGFMLDRGITPIVAVDRPEEILRMELAAIGVKAEHNAQVKVYGSERLSNAGRANHKIYSEIAKDLGMDPKTVMTIGNKNEFSQKPLDSEKLDGIAVGWVESPRALYSAIREVTAA